MYRSIIITNILFLYSILFSYSQSLPIIHANDIVITHYGYSLSYNEAHEQPNWVAYTLKAWQTKKKFNRCDDFRPDPLVLSLTAANGDYSYSGYDRGHLAPAADMSYSYTTMSESFYYSNMSPQVPAFNRGIWKKLESLVRLWAVKNSSILIVTGPVLTSNLKSIGVNKVSIPKMFYKVILDNTPPVIKGIGFLIPNTSQVLPLQSFAVSIDSVESITGIDFFHGIIDEDQIEGNYSIGLWPWVPTQ